MNSQWMERICGRLSICCLAAALTVVLAPSLCAQTRWNDNDDRSRVTPFLQGSGLWQGSDWLGNSNQQQADWQLGVTGDNTNTGVVIRSVAPGSAAAKARLESGDTILNVNGFQVGMVDGRLYDLSEELVRRADSNGAVTLIVQDNRTLRMAQVRVQLDSSSQSLTGLVSYRGRSRLPADAVVTVEIDNVSRPYYQVRHGQTAFRASPSDMPFEIAYDPNYIDPQDNYQVHATVTSGGRIILASRAQTVLTNGNPSNVRLELVPIGDGSFVGVGSGGSTGNGNGGGVVTAGYPDFDRNAIDDRITAMYRRYLLREPTFLELAALRSTPGIIDRLDTLPLELMAAQEYFDAAGNNSRVWLDAVFREIVKRQPTTTELEQWMQRYNSLRSSRTELLRQLYAQANGR